MVLPLKRWKSRSSPGIAAGAHDNMLILKTHLQFPRRTVVFNSTTSAYFRGLTGGFDPDQWVARDGAAR